MTNDIAWKLSYYEKLNPEEIYAIMSARQLVFIVEQDCPYLDFDKKDPKSLHLFATVESKIAAYCRIVPPGISYAEASIGRVITAKEFRNRKLGHELIRRAVESCREHFAGHGIRISAQAHLEKFYAAHQFQVCSSTYLEDGIPHIEMINRADLAA